jgi:leader peptidase (prepilin peptidase)/N-methyltransferase
MLDLIPQLTSLQILLVLGMTIALTATSVIDLQEKILPDIFTVIVFALGLIALWTGPIRIEGWHEALYGGATGLAGSWLFREAVWRLKNVEAMGLGDVKLFGAAGIWVGVEGIVSVALVGSIVTILAVAGKWCFTRKGSFKDEIPFGPGIAFGILFTVLFGPVAYIVFPLVYN